ncbi:helix-turn-helix domain-containing protein [Dysosmobacter sp.]|uniref:helix-turn-helix domain-containing protein n=1 Tax=Dysosmobacter sp. TaxID=2591382 RepID=UPI002A85B7F3|nr:helix-turn-helix transcriptional regulator [Dysosmobacter sp.]MDY3281450.1 helix-turn-helix transcriptional regulator [Dysosmobacter sp.]
MFPNIEAERVRCGLTREAMAEQLGVSRGTLRNWLQGNTEIPASKLAEMARLFHCSSDYLLGLRDS